MFAIYIYIPHPYFLSISDRKCDAIEMNNTETFIVVLIYYSLLEGGVISDGNYTFEDSKG